MINLQNSNFTKFSYQIIFFIFCHCDFKFWINFLRIISRYSYNVSILYNKDHGRLARWREWRACDVGEAKEGLEKELWRRWSNGRVVTAHSSTLPSLHLYHSSFSNPFVALPTSQLILQPFRRFIYVTAHSPFPLLRLRHSSFSNPSFASPTSQALTSPHEPPMKRLFPSYLSSTHFSWIIPDLSPNSSCDFQDSCFQIFCKSSIFQLQNVEN